MTITGTIAAIERPDYFKRNAIVNRARMLSAQDFASRDKFIAALIADARNPLLDYELRYGAVMQLTAIAYRRRMHAIEGHIAPEEPAEQERPRNIVTTIPKPSGKPRSRTKSKFKVIKVADARAEGLSRYFTGLPCKNGHVAERYVNNKTCVECARVKSTKQRNDGLLQQKRVA